MKPDTIIVWPDTIDYPLYRDFLHHNRDKLRKVVIVFTKTNWEFEDLRPFIKANLANDRIIFLDNDPVSGDQDWRDVAIRKALKPLDGEWIWFTEQDFLPSETFWREAYDLAKRTPIFGRYQDGRLHPCCLFMKKAVLDKTSKDFSAKPDLGYDHFGKIQAELEGKDVLVGVLVNSAGYHMNGLTHNMYLLQSGEEPNYHPEEFADYCKKCLELGNLVHPTYEELFDWYLNG